MSPVYLLRRMRDQENTVYVPNRFIQQSLSPATLSFGNQMISCRILPHPLEEVHVSQDLWEALLLPFETKIHVWLDGTRLHIGPLIGIFTSSVGLSSSRPIGERSTFFAKLLSAERKVGAFYFVFGHQQVRSESTQVEGFFYHNKSWSKHLVPLPSVIYNQLPNRKTENSTLCQDMIKKLSIEWQIPFFNPSFFNKWEIFRALESEKKAAPFLPHTVLSPSIEYIGQMLDAYPSIFLKPIGGSHGRGIIKILKSADGSYDSMYHENHHPKSMSFHSLSDLLKFHRYGRNKTTIVQQGIDLLCYGQRPVDFRVHTNKNHKGDWVVSALAAKAAGEGCITTHLAYGGEVKRAESLIRKNAIKDYGLSSLKNAALELSTYIETHTSGLIAEIGFDLALDQAGKVWLIEANSRPGRSIFSHPLFRAEDYITRLLPLQFAVHQAELAFRAERLEVPHL